MKTIKIKKNNNINDKKNNNINDKKIIDETKGGNDDGSTIVTLDQLNTKEYFANGLTNTYLNIKNSDGNYDKMYINSKNYITEEYALDTSKMTKTIYDLLSPGYNFVITEAGTDSNDGPVKEFESKPSYYENKTYSVQYYVQEEWGDW